MTEARLLRMTITTERLNRGNYHLSTRCTIHHDIFLTSAEMTPIRIQGAEVIPRRAILERNMRRALARGEQ